MKTAAILTLLSLAAGCAPKVLATTPAIPAVQLQAAEVAVISGNKACQFVADTLAQQLSSEAVFEVTPKADVKIVVQQCSEKMLPTISLSQEVDSISGIVDRKSSLEVDARAYAHVSIQTSKQQRAHLIASASWYHMSDWNRPKWLRLNRTIRKQLATMLSADLVEQIRPVPAIARRRVYPGAPPTSSRGLLTRAVAAEAKGEFRTAYELALSAISITPRRKTFQYLEGLRRRIKHHEPLHESNDD